MGGLTAESSPGAQTAFWPFFLYNGLVFVAVGAILLVSYLLGERHRARGRDIPYESGVNPTGTARLRYGAHFYPVAIFFILFDVEAAFLFAWAVAFKELGWAGYAEAALFIVVLFLGLVYVWKLGGLDWSPSRRRLDKLGVARGIFDGLAPRELGEGGVHLTPGAERGRDEPQA